MRRVTVLALLAGLALSNLGCVIALEFKDRPYQKQIIEIDGELYIVDVKTHRVRKIETDWVTETETTTETEIDVTDD